MTDDTDASGPASQEERGAVIAAGAAAILLAVAAADVPISLALVGGLAVFSAVLFAAFYALDRPWLLAGAWAAPGAAALLLFIAGDAPDGQLQFMAVVLLLVGVGGAVLWRIPAWFGP